LLSSIAVNKRLPFVAISGPQPRRRQWASRVDLDASRESDAGVAAEEVVVRSLIVEVATVPQLCALSVAFARHFDGTAAMDFDHIATEACDQRPGVRVPGAVHDRARTGARDGEHHLHRCTAEPL